LTDGGLGEANNLKIRDLELFEDDLGRRNYRFKVKGKTGERDVILRASAAKSVDCLLTRGIGVKPDDWLFVMGNDNRVITLIDQFDKVLNLASGANLTLGSRASALNPAEIRHYRRTQAYDFHH
jgi:integrase